MSLSSRAGLQATGSPEPPLGLLGHVAPSLQARMMCWAIDPVLQHGAACSAHSSRLPGAGKVGGTAHGRQT